MRSTDNIKLCAFRDLDNHIIRDHFRVLADPQRQAVGKRHAGVIPDLDPRVWRPRAIDNWWVNDGFGGRGGLRLFLGVRRGGGFCWRCIRGCGFRRCLPTLRRS